MEEGIYRMSLSENILVLIIIGIWLFAVICLARKLGRIWNPPSTLPSYYTNNKTSLSPSTFDENYPANLTESSISPPTQLIRATSEPTIDASPRTTIHLHSPSENCLYDKTILSEKVSTPSTVELGPSIDSLNPSQPNDYRARASTNPHRQLISQQSLDPKRIPSIVRRSLLDLQRRALVSHMSSNSSMNHSIGRGKEYRTDFTTDGISLPRKKYQRENAIDEDENSRGE